MAEEVAAADSSTQQPVSRRKAQSTKSTAGDGRLILTSPSVDDRESLSSGER